MSIKLNQKLNIGTQDLYCYQSTSIQKVMKGINWSFIKMPLNVVQTKQTCKMSWSFQRRFPFSPTKSSYLMPKTKPNLVTTETKSDSTEEHCSKLKKPATPETQKCCQSRKKLLHVQKTKIYVATQGILRQSQSSYNCHALIPACQKSGTTINRLFSFYNSQRWNKRITITKTERTSACKDITYRTEPQLNWGDSGGNSQVLLWLSGNSVRTTRTGDSSIAYHPRFPCFDTGVSETWVKAIVV